MSVFTFLFFLFRYYRYYTYHIVKGLALYYNLQPRRRADSSPFVTDTPDELCLCVTVYRVLAITQNDDNLV